MFVNIFYAGGAARRRCQTVAVHSEFWFVRVVDGLLLFDHMQENSVGPAGCPRWQLVHGADVVVTL